MTTMLGVLSGSTDGIRLICGCLLAMAVFITQCPLTSSWVVTAPKNAVSFEGGTVSMKCTRDVSSLPVDWEFAPAITNETSYIYTNRQIPANFTSRYKIDTDNQTRYDLIIDSVDSSHAGTYICTPLVEGTANAPSASAQLMFLESDPVCKTNASASNGGGIVEGGYLLLACTVNYTGNWYPAMQWDSYLVRHTKSLLETNRRTSSTTVQLYSSDDGALISCKTSFNSGHQWVIREPREGETLANNDPDYRYVWNYTVSVLSAPYNLTITPRKSVYVIGESIVCWSNGNPAPTYEWMEIETNRTISGSVLTIEDHMSSDKDHNFTCTANNTVAGIRRQVAEIITFRVTGSASRMTSTCMPLITVIALGYAAVLSMRV